MPVKLLRPIDDSGAAITNQEQPEVQWIGVRGQTNNKQLIIATAVSEINYI